MTGNDILTRVLEEIPGVDLSDFLYKVNSCTRKIADYGFGRWSWLAETHQIDVIEPYNTGTVSVTYDDATVTGSGTTFTSGMVGRRFRVGGYPGTFTYTTHTSGTSFEMDRTWARDSVSDKAYTIFDDTYPLPTDFRAVIGVKNLDTGKPLEEATMRANLIKSYNEGGVSERPVARYMLMGTDLVVLNNPVAATTLELWYWSRPTDMTAVGGTPDMPEYMHEVLMECVLYEYLERTYGDKDPALYAPKIQRKQSQYAYMLSQALAEDKTRGNPIHRFERVLF